MESEESVRQCSAVPGPAAAPVTQCRSRVVEAPREVCADTEVTEARELCQEVTRMEERVTCATHMKQIEIKVNKIYHTVNRLRSFLSFNHSVILSSCHDVISLFQHCNLRTNGQHQEFQVCFADKNH